MTLNFDTVWKDPMMRKILHKFANSLFCGENIEFLEQGVPASATAAKALYEFFVANEKVNISHAEKTELDRLAKIGKYADMTEAFTSAMNNIKKLVRDDTLAKLSTTLDKIKIANAANLKLARDGAKLPVIYIEPILVIGQVGKPYGGHASNLQKWITGEPKAAVEVKTGGDVVIKKSSLMPPSKGSLTFSANVIKHKTKIALQIAEFSKKKVI